jgi:hypothetical protein
MIFFFRPDLPAICSLLQHSENFRIILVGKYFDIFGMLILAVVSLRALEVISRS